MLAEWTTFNGVYYRDNLPNKIKDGVYITNLDVYSDIELIKMLCIH